MLAEYKSKSFVKKTEIFVTNFGSTDTSEPTILIDSSSLDLANQAVISKDSCYGSLSVEKILTERQSKLILATATNLSVCRDSLTMSQKESALNRTKLKRTRKVALLGYIWGGIERALNLRK
jgi:hypothetical protein